jgi:hypothetical protein
MFENLKRCIADRDLGLGRLFLANSQLEIFFRTADFVGSSPLQAVDWIGVVLPLGGE